MTPANGCVSSEEDGSGDLIGILDGEPMTYQVWAEDYYERAISLSAVQAIFEHRTLSEDLVATLNSERALSDIITDAFEIGYPSEPST